MMKLRRWLYLFIGFILMSFLLSCAKTSPRFSQKIKTSPKVVQFGRKFFVFKNKTQSFIFKGVKKVENTSEGFWVEPVKDCFSIISQNTHFKICLKPVPPISPHLKVLRIDSYGVDLRVLSLFSKVYLLVWEKGKPPSFYDLERVSLGNVELKDLSLGKTYFISGVIKFGENLYGPLSQPLAVKVEDKEPPLPPSGGGYLVKNGELILLWDPSPSRDVAGYVVEREGKTFKVKSCTFKEKLFKSEILYKIKAVDRAGNMSLPLYIHVCIKQ